MKLMIVGGTGIFGNAIAKRALDAGHRVVTLSNGEPAEWTSPAYQHVRADRDDAPALRRAVQSAASDGGFDLVVDLLCYRPSHPRTLHAALSPAAPLTVMASTTLVYRPAAGEVSRTDDEPERLHRLGPYAREKLLAEREWLDIHRETKHPVVILRLPHMIGEGSQLGPVPLHNRDPYVIQRMLAGKPLLLAEGGRVILQIVSADDAARVILTLVGQERAIGRVYNCAYPKPLSAREYFEHMARALEVRLQVRAVPSEVIAASNWGWGLTLPDRVVCMEALERDVGCVPDAAPARIIGARARGLANRALDERDARALYLDRLDFESRVTLTRSLNVAATARGRSAVDVRMNMGWPVPEPLPASDRRHEVEPAPDAAGLLALARNRWAVDLMLAAYDLGAFRALMRAPRTVEQLGAALRLEPRPARVLVTGLVAMGLIHVDHAGVLHPIASTAAVLNPDSRTDLAAYIDLSCGRGGWRELAEALRRNRPFGPSGAALFGESRRTTSPLDDKATAATVASALGGHASAAAPALVGAAPCEDARTLLDLGGGPGAYAIAYLLDNPRLHATIIDYPNMLAAARERACSAGVADRITFRDDDLFEADLPRSDIVLLSNVLHDWDEAACRTLIGRAADAVTGRGAVLVHETLLSDQLDGPLSAALHSVAVFALTRGRLYSAVEFAGWLRHAGLTPQHPRTTWGGMSVIVAQRPPTATSALS